jgi:predicted transcriptional regulator
MVKLDKDELIRKALIGRKKYWDNKHQSDRDLILQLKSKGYSVKKIQSELDISTPTYYKRLNELKKLGLIK